MKFLFDIDNTLNSSELHETFLLASLVSKEHGVVFITSRTKDDFVRSRFSGEYELHVQPKDDPRDETTWKGDLLNNMAGQEETILVNALNLSRHTSAVFKAKNKVKK